MAEVELEFKLAEVQKNSEYWYAKYKELQEHHKKVCEELTNTHRNLGEKIKDLEWQLQEVAKDNDNYQEENKKLTQILLKKYKQIDELFHNVSELNHLLTEAEERNTKEKDLLAKWVELYKPKSDTALPTPIQVDTEQFLSEVEK